ncbi:MAG TPA: site-2 protease family protein [bacterium]|nr:site-2 protease family protein [bacterium]
MILFLSVIILIFSAIVHEYAHGWMANRLGDDTALRAGRLTFNPLKHLDPIGSVLLPLLLIISKANFFFAWAKPVPYNPYNLRDHRYGDLKVALAGPGINIILAIIFGLIARFIPLANDLKISLLTGFFQGEGSAITAITHSSFLGSLVLIAMVICFINLALAVFNLLPIPPLDGSKIVYTFLSDRGRETFYKIEKYGFILLFALVMIGAFDFMQYIIFSLFSVVTGV